MKQRFTLLATALFSCMVATAQRTPEHNYDFDTKTNWDQLADFFDAWEVGTPANGISKIDDQFFISRQRPLARITDGDYQVQKNVPAGRKMLLWVPLDDPTSTWKSLPRYCFEGDNFSMWQYINCHGNWTAPWMRVTAGLTDAAAKNGVTVGSVMSIPWAYSIAINSSDNYSKRFAKLGEKNADGTFKNSLKVAKLMKYYGINGLGVNSEFNSNATTMKHIMAFFADVHKKAESIGWKFEVQWYDLTNDYGRITMDAGLGGHNKGMFGTGDNIVSDYLFANYNWSATTLSQSSAYAKTLNRDPYDYYAGFDIQGRGLRNLGWQNLIDSEISVGFWGAHSQSLLHQSATDDGTSDVAIQKAYQKKLELVFSGGNRNPGLLPAVRTDATLGNADLKTFHGLARLLTAKSTIQQVPFVTRFNLGNGLKFYKEGNATFDSKWYNLSVQDYLPTWRFWITDKADVVTTANIKGLINAELVWDEVYTGGSSLQLSGKTAFSRVKLFKTMLETQPSYELSIVYKLKKGTATNAKLFVALKDDVTNYKEIAIPNAKSEGTWTTFTTTLDKLGLKAGDKVAMIGLAFEGTGDDYQMNVGELALRNPAQSFATVQPKIKEVEVLRGRATSIDFKMRYASKEESGETKTYNDEVGTWYYEIYFQQKGEEPQLLTATQSWAAYVIGAPIKAGDERNCRFGVRAVSPDGVKGSEIAWSDYQSVPYDSQSTTVAIDRAVIKPNETFKVYYEDVMADAAKSWAIIDPATNTPMATAKNATSITAKIAKVGVYDLRVVTADGKTIDNHGFIQVTPESTGAVPTIADITTNATGVVKQNAEVQYTFTGRKGEGKVSRALKIQDPDMLSIPAATQTGMAYSIALWFKADGFAHDKQGTNLISKNYIGDSWPHNNWGDLWVQIRPEFKTHPANEISFNTMGWSAHDDPNENMMTTGYSVQPGVWTHLVVTQDAGKVQKMYFNGKCVAGPTAFAASTRREVLAKTDGRIKGSIPANIYIGGGGVYKAGFKGAIDEVQVWNKALTDAEVLEAMNGYTAGNIPDGLQGYYTFEEVNSNGAFTNQGKLANQDAKVVRTAGSGGEDTSGAEYVQQTADNGLLGYPGVPGTLDVKTTATWNTFDANVVKQEGDVVTVSYVYGGKKNVALTLENRWGAAKMEKAEIVEVEGPENAIDGVEESSFSVYPNPFVESVNFRFAEGGNYTINVVSSNGAVLQRNNVEATAGQVVNVAVTGKAGLYIVQIVKDGKQYKSVKVVKE